MNNEEPNLYYYWKIIVKKRWSIIIIALCIIGATSLINFLMPKEYQGKSVVKMPYDNFSDIIVDIDFSDKVNLPRIFPKTYDLVSGVDLIPTKDSSLVKFSVFMKKP